MCLSSVAQRWTTEDKHILVDAQSPARIALRILNYPAWRIEVNGKGVEAERMEDVNQMVIAVGAGLSEIRVRFGRTGDRTAGNAITLVSGLLAATLLWLGQRVTKAK